MKIKNNNVFLGKKVIGTIKDKVFISKRVFEKHLYRYLNAWAFNAEIFKLDLDYFLIKTPTKQYGIKIDKVKEFKSKINPYITFAQKSEKQVAIPLIIFNEKDEHGLIEKGISIDEFIDLIQNKKNVYKNWKRRNRLQWTQSFKFL